METPKNIQPDRTYWHFMRENRILPHGDGRLVTPGITLTVPGKPILCKRGFHACARVIDALYYSPGPVACLVTLGGKVATQKGEDKVCAQERTALWIYDASQLLREFACDLEEQALLSERNAGREPDARRFAAIEVARRFFRGEITEKELSEAHFSAYSAAHSAARLAVRSAARLAAHWPVYSADYSALNDDLTQRLLTALNDDLTQSLLTAKASGQGEFAPAADSPLTEYDPADDHETDFDLLAEAAPELLAALENVTERFADLLGPGGNGEIDGDAAAIEAARAAIAKAKGGNC